MREVKMRFKLKINELNEIDNVETIILSDVKSDGTVKIPKKYIGREAIIFVVMADPRHRKHTLEQLKKMEIYEF